MIDTLFSNPFVGLELARRIADRRFIDFLHRPSNPTEYYNRDWDAIGKDFRMVGDDIRTAMRKFPVNPVTNDPIDSHLNR